MRRRLAALAVVSALALTTHATAAAAPDPIGDMIMSVVTGSMPGAPGWNVKATLYHVGAKGVGNLDSLGCKVVAMRTVAVDRTLIPRRSILYIRETVGLKRPDGSRHDGYWYASDTGGAIKGKRIDLFTGYSAASMNPLKALNLSTLSAVKVGEFKGCPPR